MKIKVIEKKTRKPIEKAKVYLTNAAFSDTPSYTDKNGVTEIKTYVGANVVAEHKCYFPSSKPVIPGVYDKMTFELTKNGNCQEQTNTGNNGSLDLTIDTPIRDILFDDNPIKHETGTSGTSGTSQSQTDNSNSNNSYQTGGVKTSENQTENRKTMKFQIVDATNNEPLPGAEVLNVNTGKGAVSDYNGNVSIDAQKGDTIVIKFLGYKTLKEKAEKIPVVIKLTPDPQELDEVVITATKKRKFPWLLLLGAGLLLFRKSGMNGPEVSEPIEVEL